MFVGVPGSGKTTFAEQLADHLGAVTLNSDAIRLSMWGSREEIWKTHADLEQRAHGNQLTFGAMDYAAAQVLKAGHSVVYDCNANKRWERGKMAELATTNGGRAILVHIKTPHELAIKRIITRNEAEDSMSKNPEKVREIVERFAAAIEEPTTKEKVALISGEADFKDQLEVFQAALSL